MQANIPGEWRRTCLEEVLFGGEKDVRVKD
jgi:hypothetical protein